MSGVIPRGAASTPSIRGTHNFRSSARSSGVSCGRIVRYASSCARNRRSPTSVPSSSGSTWDAWAGMTMVPIVPSGRFTCTDRSVGGLRTASSSASATRLRANTSAATRASEFVAASRTRCRYCSGVPPHAPIGITHPPRSSGMLKETMPTCPCTSASAARTASLARTASITGRSSGRAATANASNSSLRSRVAAFDARFTKSWRRRRSSTESDSAPLPASIACKVACSRPSTYACNAASTCSRGMRTPDSTKWRSTQVGFTANDTGSTGPPARAAGAAIHSSNASADAVNTRSRSAVIVTPVHAAHVG